MSERKAGWYWVKPKGEPDWLPGYWNDDPEVMLWNVMGKGFASGRVGAVGPRIPTPDEPWQTVPTSETDEMVEQGAQAIVSWDEGCTWPQSWGLDAVRHRKDCRKAYRAMLAAAPTPGGGDER